MTSLSGPATFADDGRSVIERSLEPTAEPTRTTSIEDEYEIDQTVRVIQDGNFQKVALQFPDDLLSDSTEVFRLLRERLPIELYILADTTFGSCCVDEVAAEHANADLVVHYGRTCLSKTSRIPVHYVFGKASVAVQACVDGFESLFSADRQRPILLVYDVIYQHCSDALYDALRGKGYANLANSVPDIDDYKSRFGEERGSAAASSIRKTGRRYLLQDGHGLQDYTLFYVGSESLTLTNILMTHRPCPVYSYDPKTNDAREESYKVNRLLNRRYYLLQQAKDASVIGIVVGTLGAASYLSIINDLKRLIIASGKKPYLLAMGKPNPAKLGNFLEIDCFVLVACPENSLLDSREFLRPIVTPYELELALVKSHEWNGTYETDLSVLAPRLREEAGEAEKDGRGDVREEEPHFSLVTGKLKQARLYDTNPGVGGDEEMDADGAGASSTAVAVRDANSALARFDASSPAAQYLAERRTFRGLDKQEGGTEVVKAEEGRSGVARGYSHEDGKADQLGP
ncbi:Diphthamide biosynthesis protein 2 [Rhizophlyctis rosea]|nr:Diphthamide biosynthesis protein 2 [Rhizophlyctis rosea]